MQVTGEPGRTSSTSILRYKNEERRPINCRLPQLTGERDHPGTDLPAFHFAFEVTPDQPAAGTEQQVHRAARFISRCAAGFWRADRCGFVGAL
jgi:hypothetical protein